MFKKIVSLFFAFSLLSVAALAAPSSWANTEVNLALKAGLVPESITDDYQKAITREEFCETVMLLYGSLGGQTPAAQNPFKDTDNSAVTSAYAAHIVEGIGEGLFAPQNTITRQEICTMLKRCILSAKPEAFISDYFPNTFPDSEDIAPWAMDSVQYINMLEIMLGDETGKINPLNNTTREQAILLVYRLKSAFSDTFDWLSAYYGFMKSGNTSTNMLGGAFAVTSLSGTLYISDSRGISMLSENAEPVLITPVTASAIYPDSTKAVYFINAEDNLIYSVTQGSEPKQITSEKAKKFLISGERLFFLHNDDDAIYSVPILGGTATRITEGGCEMPIPAGNTLYYSDGKGIIKRNIVSGDTEYLYSGIVKNMTYENGSFFFTNDKSFLCSLTDSSSNTPKVISSIPVDKYCIYDDGIIYAAEGSVFKCDLKQRFNIRLGNYSGEDFNSFGKKIYIKDTNGSIYEFNSKTLEKTQIN